MICRRPRQVVSTRSWHIVGLLCLPITASNAKCQYSGFPLDASRPERFLSGIDIYDGSLQRVFSRLENPSHVTTAARHEGSVAIREYSWETEDWLLRVSTYDGDPNSSAIVSIDVWGKHSDGEIGTTGAGLKLGGSLRDARRIYGDRFNYEPHGFPYLATPFDPPDRGFVPKLQLGSPVLEVDFDQTGTITHLKLTNPCGRGCW